MSTEIIKPLICPNLLTYSCEMSKSFSNNNILVRCLNDNK